LFKEGQPAAIMPAGSSSTVDGKVLLVAPAADTKTRKFLVKVTPTASDSPLKAGMSANVSIQTGKQENALLVPKDAVLQRNGQQIVFADENGRAKQHVVQTALGNDTQVRVTDGLDDGAQIILPGSIDLSDGDLVVPAATTPAPAN
jgi:RND family efflux transporter MFP subunit